MNEFDAAGEADMALALVAAHARAGQGQHWAQPFAAGGDDSARDLRDQDNRTVHPVDDGSVDLLNVVLGQRCQRVNGRLWTLLTFAVEVDDDAHDCLDS